jgi:hypothetical protein
MDPQRETATWVINLCTIRSELRRCSAYINFVLPFSTVNIDNKVGSVGFIPRFVRFLLNIHLIKVDKYTGEPIRDPKTGLAIHCGPNEPGELVGVIKEGDPIKDFQG